MKKLSFILSMFICIGCSELFANEIKPQLFTNYFTGLESEVVTSYSSVKLNFDLTLRSGKNLHFANCNQVEEITAGDIVMGEFHLLKMLQANCIALKKFARAENSNATYLQEILDKKNISNLPATAYPYVNEYDESQRLGKSLGEFYNKFNTSLDINGAIQVETETERLIYQIIATGDFNGDKIQDALIRIDWQALAAFGKGFKLIMVTKKSPEKPYEINMLN